MFGHAAGQKHSQDTAQDVPGRARYALAATRILLGGIFFWAFLDKLFGLGFATPPERSWLAGGSPTSGFLANATKGPFAGVFKAMAGNGFVDVLFMVGLACIGLALLLGVGVRVAAYTGSLLLALMWLAALPPANHPFLDDHVVYTAALLAVAWTGAGRTLGLGAWWAERDVVKRHPVLE